MLRVPWPYLLAGLPRPARLAVAALMLAAIAALTGIEAIILFGSGDSTAGGFQALYVGMHLAAVAICALRAALVREERGAWACIAAAIGFWSLAWISYFLFVQQLESPPYPSPSDALYLAFYPCFFVGLMLLLRARIARFKRSLFLDALVAAITLAAFAAALLGEPILNSTGGELDAVATNLAYPMSDALTALPILAGFALSGWRPGRAWMALALAWAIMAATDTVYLYQAAGGNYQPGQLLDLGWPVAMVAFALVAWRRPDRVCAADLEGGAVLVAPLSCAALALALTVYSDFGSISRVAVLLATLALVLAMVRTVLAFAEVRTEARSRELTARHELILNSAGEGIYGLDREGVTTFANEASGRLTGWAPDELFGRRQHGFVHHSRADGSPYPADESPVHLALRDGQVHHVSHEVYWRKDGTSFPVEYTSTPIVEDGEVTGAVVVFRDITERREVERMKDEFTSVVSHELRTPLTSIRGSLGLLASGALGPLPEKGQRMAEIAVQNSDRLVRLINDILDIERMGSGVATMERRPCSAGQLAAQAVEVMRPMAGDAGVRLELDGGDGRLWADPDRMQQLLTNLLSNAIKFSPGGGTVRVRVEAQADHVLLQVEDEGRGIPADKLEPIFYRFQQVDASDSRDKGGTGLGLAICAGIDEGHGGRIWAESEEGRGSVFNALLPRLQEAEQEPLPGGVPRATVLVCDDDPDVMQVVVALLEEHGYRALRATSGEEAVQKAALERPDAILLDLLMPEMDGWQTAMALRERAGVEETPILVLSVLSERNSERPAGNVRGWVEKPFDESALVGALGRALGGRDEVSRVLVVEDDEDLASVIVTSLGRHGIETFHAADGERAIELSRRVVPDLVVLDLGLPGLDGFDVVETLRHDERMQLVPLVVYTARDLDQGERHRLTLGGKTDFVTKSRVPPEQFERRVVHMLTHLVAGRERSAADAHPGRR